MIFEMVKKEYVPVRTCAWFRQVGRTGSLHPKRFFHLLNNNLFKGLQMHPTTEYFKYRQN